jgi:hypothetical protein
MDDENGEGGYRAYCNVKRSSLMLLGHREKKQLIYEQIVSKIKCYVAESSDSHFYIEKIRFDHPEPIAQLKKVAMALNKSINHHSFFLVEPNEPHTVYEQVGQGIKYYLTKAPNYHEMGYYLDKISIERPISLNMFRNTTIGCLHSSGRVMFRARDAAMLVHKDGEKTMFEVAYQTCGDKELAEKAVEQAHTYLREHPDVVARLERMYARQVEKLSFFQKWFHL